MIVAVLILAALVLGASVGYSAGYRAPRADLTDAEEVAVLGRAFDRRVRVNLICAPEPGEPATAKKARERARAHADLVAWGQNPHGPLWR